MKWCMKSVLPPGSMEHMLYATDVFSCPGMQEPEERQPWTLFGRAPPTPPEPEMSFPCREEFFRGNVECDLQWGSGCGPHREPSSADLQALSPFLESVLIPSKCLETPSHSFLSLLHYPPPQPGSPQVFQYWHRFLVS